MQLQMNTINDYNRYHDKYMQKTKLVEFNSNRAGCRLSYDNVVIERWPGCGNLAIFLNLSDASTYRCNIGKNTFK